MPLLDYIVILFFSLMVVLVGLSFSRSGQSIKSYFAAGGSLPWWLSALSLFMSFFSAGTFVVWGSIAYEFGWVAITIQWMMGLGGFIIGWWIAPGWRKTGVLTVGTYIGERFGNRLRKFYSYVFLLLSFVTTGAFLYPVARIFNVSTGFSLEGSVIVLGLMVMLYTAAGGLWAVIITDVLQFVILFAAVLIVIPLAMQKTGGLASLVQNAPEDFFNLTNGPYTWLFLLAFLFYNTIFIGGNWAYVQRYTSVASPQEARKVGFLFGFLYLVSPILWMLPAMMYRDVAPSLSGLENEGAFLLMCKEVLPAGMLGLMLGGMIFATASSVNTTLNMSAAVFTHDLFHRLFPQTSRKRLMQTARISTLVFGLVTIGVALLVPQAGGIVEVVISVGALTGAPLFAPPIWSLFSRHQTGRSILITTIISLLVNVSFKFITPLWFDLQLDRAQEMFLGVFFPLLMLGFFEIYYRNIRKVSMEYVIKPSGQVISGIVEDEPAGQNSYALRILGIALLITGLLITFLGMIAPSGQIVVALIGVLISGLGVLLFRGGQKD